MTGASRAAVGFARSRLAMHRHTATTPGRLRLAAALLAVGAVAFGAVAAQVADMRRTAAHDVASTEPLLISAVGLSASLSDAHAAAAYSFLVGGREPATSRRRYLRELQRAGAHVAELAGGSRSSARSRAAVRRITQMLPVYAGLIDSARANNRQGLAVGSAYLRRAAETMRDQMLPSARELYDIEAEHLARHYRAGTSAWTTRAVILAGCVLLALLTASQVYVARATRRIVNPGLALASAVLLGLMTWILVAFAAQKTEMVRTQRTGSDRVELLTTTRSLVSRAQADESIVLADPGIRDDPSRLPDVDVGFQALTNPIGSDRPGHARGSGGLLDEAAASGHRVGAIDAIYASYRRYRHAHRLVVEQAIRGNFAEAVKRAVGATRQPSTKRAAAELNAALDREVVVAEASTRARFDRASSRAQAALGGLAVGIPLLTALCAVLALLGVRERLKEYR